MKQTLVLLCASHVSSSNRYLSLEVTIEHCLAQTHLIPCYFSISYTEAFSQEIQTLYKKYEGNNIIHLFLQKTGMSQFQHFHSLCDKIEYCENTWCIFCDDDDYCPSWRNRIFQDQINTIQDDNVFSFWLPQLVICTQKLKHPSALPTLCMSVGHMLRDGPITSGEYVTYTLRVSKLKIICDIMRKHNVIETPGCDVLFGTILQNTIITQNYNNTTEWLYAYHFKDDYDSSSRKSTIQNYLIWYKEEIFNDIEKHLNMIFTNKIPPVYDKNRFLNNKKYQKRRHLWNTIPSQILTIGIITLGGNVLKRCLHLNPFTANHRNK
jgi:Fe-S cluster assembly iron-binding protein IscA